MSIPTVYFANKKCIQQQINTQSDFLTILKDVLTTTIYYN